MGIQSVGLSVCASVCLSVRPHLMCDLGNLGSIFATFLLVLGTGLDRFQTSTASGAGPFGIDFCLFFCSFREFLVQKSQNFSILPFQL